MTRVARLALIGATAGLVPIGAAMLYFGLDRGAQPPQPGISRSVTVPATAVIDPPAMPGTRGAGTGTVATDLPGGTARPPGPAGTAMSVAPEVSGTAGPTAVGTVRPPTPAASSAGLRGPVLVAPEGPVDVRNVTPPGVTPPPAVTGPLERLPAREPVRKPLGPPKLRVLRPILVESAGVVRAGDVRVRLAGITAPASDETCRDATGQDWPCGARAAVALRAFVRGRGLQCTVPEGAREGDFVSPCRLGSEDVGRWLVRQGWAKAAGDDLGADETEARRAGLGLWAAAAPTPAD
ncbi:thermonuclease family protein [Prosthecodimorpha staleyi]|uniref:Thermonuclease family protein n=1 Tax=Prosthecodimorpha staleyi TaxID=2840188 RepID=A0A947DB02_9HYPH|nr:thermonuclease family protein [Prosthecodimorpha staleyi]MBT9292042.1 thermonuclease family protein [Prosthecodimorpha staleyi]